ncbi:hypothetical protein [Paenibacillus sp. y28]|uniref:hypothetical protein n=1 Tax=Paenibacillus sp. y28 TaxID=3129110 RepID=UPI00301A4A32
MVLKSLIISLYLLGAYWASLQFPALHMIFFPTLGAFCYLFLTRKYDMKEVSRISVGAVVSSTFGSIMYMLDWGLPAFFVTCLMTIWMIRRWHWNAPPIVAVALIPFFSHPAPVWGFPLSVLLALAGLHVTIWLLQAADHPHLPQWMKLLVHGKIPVPEQSSGGANL